MSIPDKRQAQLVGSGGFRTMPSDVFWDSQADVEPEGSIIMSRICVFSPIRNLSGGAGDQHIFGKTASGNVGWNLLWTNNRAYRFNIDDGGGTARAVFFAPTAIPQKDECVVWCGSYNETELITYAKGESAVTGPWVGYLPTNVDVAIGARSDGILPARDFNVIACLATDTYALSVAQMELAEAAIAEMLNQGQEIDVSKLPGSGWLWRWDARNIHREKKGEWKDDISNVVLSEVGEMQLHAVQARF